VILNLRPRGSFDSGAPIALRELPEGEKSRAHWGSLLVLFMRLLTLLWMFQGISQWLAIILPKENLFQVTSPAWISAVIFFGLVDLVAAIGLWLATPWGGVLWLLAALSQMFVSLSLPLFYPFFWVTFDGLLIILYFILTWLASQTKKTPLLSRW
jgi:hypothetical protein